MIFSKDQKENIYQRIDFIRIQISDLGQFKDLIWKAYNDDRNIQRNLERLAENVANASIDICKITLASEDVSMPNSYKDIIIKLGEVGVLTGEQANKLAEYAGLRNFLAHEYLDLKWDKLKGFIANAAKDYDGFISAVLTKIGK